MSEQKKPMPAPQTTPPAPVRVAETPIADPKVVKLLRPKEPSGALQDVIPVAPVAPAGPAPRLIHDNERAPEGLRRFAIRHKELPNSIKPKRYVLAKSQEEAEAYYRRYAGLEHGASLIVKAMPD